MPERRPLGRAIAGFAGATRGLAARPWLHLAICLGLGGVASLLAGAPDDWDLQNYHIYGPWALLEGRHGRDLNAVGAQSFFNPLLHLPYYLLAVRWLGDWPRLVGFISGLPYGLLAWLVFLLARRLPGGGGSRRRWLAMAIGLTGSLVMAEIGSAIGDIVACIPLVGAVILALRALEGRAGWALAAGGLAGLAGGLKLPFCVFAPGLVLGLLAAGGGVAAAALLCLGWVGGFAAAYGVWGWGLWAEYGNPVFPMLNGVFRSAWAGVEGGMDRRFMPRDLWQTLAYPFWWLRGKEGVASELGIRDPRFAVAYVAALVLLLRAPWRADARVRLLLVFVVVGFVLWQATFSILRYAMPLEVLTGLVILAGLQALLPARRVTWAGFAALVGILALTGWPGWGRLGRTPARLFEITAPLLPDGSVVVTGSKPVGFVLPFLQGADLRFVGLVDLDAGSGLEAAVLARLRAASQVSLLVFRSELDVGARLAAVGWRFDPAACVEVQTKRRRWAEIVLCRGRREG